MIISSSYRATSIVTAYCSTIDERLGVLGYFSALVNETRYHPALLSDDMPAERLEALTIHLLRNWAKYAKALDAEEDGCLDATFSLKKDTNVLILRDFQTIFLNCEEELGWGVYKEVNQFADIFTGEKCAKITLHYGGSPELLLKQIELTDQLRGFSGLCLPFFRSKSKLMMLTPFRHAFNKIIGKREREKISLKEFCVVSIRLIDICKRLMDRMVIVNDLSLENTLFLLNDREEIVDCELHDFDYWKVADSPHHENFGSENQHLIEEFQELARFTEGDCSFIDGLCKDHSWDTLTACFRSQLE